MQNIPASVHMGLTVQKMNAIVFPRPAHCKKKSETLCANDN